MLRGRLRLEFRDHVTELEPGQCCVVPRGVEHHPVADRGVLDRAGRDRHHPAYRRPGHAPDPVDRGAARLSVDAVAEGRLTADRIDVPDPPRDRGTPCSPRCHPDAGRPAGRWQPPRCWPRPRGPPSPGGRRSRSSSATRPRRLRHLLVMLDETARPISASDHVLFRSPTGDEPQARPTSARRASAAGSRRTGAFAAPAGW